MPLYEYACVSCGVHTEVVQRVGAPPLASCPHCGGPVHKVLAPPALHFKGTGWYVTDYGRGNGSKAEGHTNGKTSGETAQASGTATSSDNGKKP